MRVFVSLLAFVLMSCSGAPVKRAVAGATLTDPYLWLEDVEGERALEFVKAENAATFAALKTSPGYASIEAEIRKIVLAKDRLPSVSLMHGKLYNFWQDADHVRGLWRRTTIEKYKLAVVDWETVLDLDAISAAENENWVWKGATCLEPEEKRCLLTLSRGGKDASVVREFDTVTKTFVPNGFFLPENKSNVGWITLDSIYVGTDFGPGTLSDSGYPIVSKLWKRGTALATASETFRGQTSDVEAQSHVMLTPEGSYAIHSRNLSFFEFENWIEIDGQRLKIPMPKDANFTMIFAGHLIYTLTSDLKTRSRTYITGSVVALPIGRVKSGEAALESLTVVFAPSKKIFLTATSRTRDTLLLGVLDNVKGRILKVTRGGGRWKTEPVPLTGNGVASVSSTSAFSNEFLASYTDFLTPTSIYSANVLRTGHGLTSLKSAPARFDADGLTSEQFEAVSADGTKIPYFIVHKKNMVLDGMNPTLMYGYGGFEISMTPSYLSSVGKVWVERGGVYVLANIRGGGEFGPAWHTAAQKENHQRAFDDFIAVAQDLIKRKVTSPKHLGIQGGSNGGLLTGAVFVQRPDLFNAALVEVPLLDMLRYHKLLAGASWMDEYGNPEDPVMREAILKYSPYQNVKAEGKYPEVFFLTSTKDDRVHPAHARKMVARMREYGHPIYYFENVEGGHGGSANLEQKIVWSSLEYTYLWKKLAR